MRKTVHKWFWAWEFKEEEKWLNEMSSIGLHLVSMNFTKYIFDEGIPSEYTYRIELLDSSPTSPTSIQYLKFLEGTGVEYIGNCKTWVYLRKKQAEGEFDLFSDRDSRLKHLHRIKNLLITPIILLLLCLVYNLIYSVIGNFKLINISVTVYIILVTILLLRGYFSVRKNYHQLKKELTLYE